MKKQYPLQVGILLEQPVIRFEFRATYQGSNGKPYKGEHSAMCQNGKVLFDGQLYDELTSIQWGKKPDDMDWIVKI